MRKLFGLLYLILFAQLTDAQGLFEQFNALSDKAERIGLHSGNLDSATCVRMLGIAQALNNDSLLAISYNYIGEYATRIKGDHVSGLNYYFKAVPLAEESNDKRRLSSLYFDISLVYFTLRNNEESFKYIRKGGANLPSNSHPLYDFMLAQYQRGMAIYFVDTNQPDSALSYAQPFLLTSNKIRSPLFLFSAYYLTAAAYDEQHDNDVAETFFRKATTVSDSIYSPFALLHFGQIYIPFLLQNKRLTDAKIQARHLINIGAQLNNNDLKLAGTAFMQQVYDVLHITDSAYHYSKTANSLNALIFNENNLNKIQSLAFNEQIRSMEQEAKEKQLRQRRHQTIQFVLIALGIIVFILIFLLLSRSIIANERLISFFTILGLLVIFEFINLVIHPWLSHLTHESPVLMLLSLVLIASLLIPLHHRLEHWIKEKMIKKNKAIRLAAAKKTIKELGKESEIN